MINPKELIIGAYYIDPNQYESKVDLYTWEFEDDSEGEYLKNCEPIEITEEWLIKLGFSQRLEKRDERFYKQLELTNWSIRLTGGMGLWRVEQGFINQFSTVTELKHIHKLQMLFFALTGEELKVVG